MVSSHRKQLSYKVYGHCYALPARPFTAEDDTHVIGGGLCCDGVWITESGLFPSSLASYEFDPSQADYVDDDVVFIGCMSPVWGHAITDGLKHLWWFRTEDYLNNHAGKRLYYWGPKPLSGNFLELVRLAGVDISKLHYIDHVMLFRSVIVPDISFNYTKGWACEEYLETIHRIISNSRPTTRIDGRRGGQKVFLSERDGLRTWGVKSIEKVARRAGFTIYYPGEHSLQEQISVFCSASTVMSFESSIGHNTVFCRPGTQLIMLRKANYENKYQAIINELWAFDVTTVDANLSMMNDDRFPYAGPFFVYPNEALCQAIGLSPQLQEVCHFPRKIFRKYFRWILWDGERSLAHRLSFSEHDTGVLAHEVTKYREWQTKLFSHVFRYIPLPKWLKEKAVRKIAKYKVRHFI